MQHPDYVDEADNTTYYHHQDQFVEGIRIGCDAWPQCPAPQRRRCQRQHGLYHPPRFSPRIPTLHGSKIAEQHLCSIERYHHQQESLCKEPCPGFQRMNDKRQQDDERQIAERYCSTCGIIIFHILVIRTAHVEPSYGRKEEAGYNEPEQCQPIEILYTIHQNI